MIESLVLSLAVAASNPTLAPPVSTAKQPTLYCREIISGASASQSLKICRTKAQWQRHDSCNGSVTRYCEAKRKAIPAGATLGGQTAFALSEDSRIVCRVMSITGTRVRQSNICLPKREWDRMWQDASRNAFKAQDWSKLVGPDQ